jgi:hypothetical protein
VDIVSLVREQVKLIETQKSIAQEEVSNNSNNSNFPTNNSNETTEKKEENNKENSINNNSNNSINNNNNLGVINNNGKEYLAYDFISRRMHYLPTVFDEEFTSKIIKTSKKNQMTVCFSLYCKFLRIELMQVPIKFFKIYNSNTKYIRKF